MDTSSFISSDILRYAGIVLVLIGVFWYVRSRKNGGLPTFSSQGKGGAMLSGMATDLTEKAREATIDPVIGRENEIMRVTQILTRRTKNNVILVGPPGVGKTAIVEGLALRIVTGDIPPVLRHKRILSLQVAELLAGTKYRGEFEQRIKSIVEEIKRSNRSIILFIDEVHTVMQTRGTEGAVNFSDILKPALARGDLQLVGATTQKEYDEFIRPDASLERRFQLVLVDEPTVEEAIDILRGLKKSYETYHKVHFSDEAIEAAVRLSEEYIKGRTLPDKAIDIIDEAAAMINVNDPGVHDHAIALLHGAATKIMPRKTEEEVDEPETIKKLKAELTALQNQEQEQTDEKKIRAIRKKITEKVKQIEEQEIALASSRGWPTVEVEHIKEVVAEWVGMDAGDIH